LVGFAGLPAAYVAPSSSQGVEPANETSTTAATSFGTTWTSTIPTLTTASDEIKVGNKTLGNLNAAYSANQVVLKYHPLAKKHATEKHHDVKSEKKLLLERVVVLNVTEGKVKEVIEALRNDPDVEYVEPNYIRTISFIPNDPYYVYQWHFSAVQMQQAWDISTGSGVTVAVIDTGVAYEDYLGFRRAPDLSGTVFLSGWDFVNNDAHPNDDNSHGTHVCGTIAQTTNNGIGVAGVAFNARIMPIKVLDQQGNGWDSDVANGITWAVNNGAKIISLSLGGPDYSQTLEDAVNYAYTHGVTVVASSGNDNSGSVGYPAAYVNAIAVGAVRYDQTRAYYSNYGTALDFVAPGGDVYVDQNGDGYADGVLQQTFASGDPTSFAYYFWQGTSMAAPHVSGLAALLYAAGYTTPDQIRQRMINGAKDLGSLGWDQYYGYGLIQCYNSLLTTTVTRPLTLTSTVSSTSYTTRYTTRTVTSYTSTTTSTSTVPTVTTVALLLSTVTSVMQSVQYLTSTLTTTFTSYTGTQTSTSTIPTLTTVALVPLTVTSIVQSIQYLTSILTTTVTSYTSTSTNTIPTVTTVALVPSTTTATAQSTEYLTSIVTTTVTSYTSTLTSTVPTVTTVGLVPLTTASTVQSTEYQTSTATSTVTSYTSTTTSTSTSVVYTTVTKPLAGAGASNPLAYLGFISLLAVAVGDRVTAGNRWSIPKVRSLMERRCSRS
jgi:serine protease